jgi:RNA polymerase sigma-70 factor (ECF subfamily)
MRSGELDDGTLARARAGDPRAFRALYEHHAHAVHLFLRRMLRDDAAAQDALQDAFLRVLRALGRFDPRGPARLSTWIFTIARRVALTAIEQREARRRAASAAPSSLAVVHPQDLRLLLEAAVAELPEALRSTFVLRECCELSYEEVAAVESVDIGTVKSRLHRARLALQDRLSDEAEDDGEDDEGKGVNDERSEHGARASR